MLTIQIQTWQDCNLNCKHCWRDARFNHIKLDTELVVSKLDDFVDFYNSSHWTNEKIIISLTWWEITLFFDKILPFFSLLEKYANIELRLFTNWLNITPYKDFLERYKDRIWIQISIDWLESEHDYMRWKWTFQKSINSIRILWDAWFRVRAQAVITERNHKNLFFLLKFLSRLPIKEIWFRKLLDVWRVWNIWWVEKGTSDIENRNNFLYYVYSNMLKLSKNLTGIDKPLFFWCDTVALVWDNHNYSSAVWMCWVHIKRIIGIDYNGEVQLCPRLPIWIGNIYEDSLIDLYLNKYSQKYESLFTLNKKCAGCDVKNRCNGWDLCETYAYYGNLDGHKALICRK